MNNDDLTVTDVLADHSKNFSAIYQSIDEEDEDSFDTVTLHDNEYYTESEFLNITTDNNLDKENHLTILSLNIANLLSKLTSLKRFLNHIASHGKKPDVVCLVETHINDSTNAGYDKTLSNIIPGYDFFHQGRKSKKGGGVGILVSKDLQGEAALYQFSKRKVPFIEEQFENLVVRIPECIDSDNPAIKRDLVVAAIYRQPNNGNLENFLGHMENLLFQIDKPKNEIVITGDMNLDLLKYNNHQPTSKYLDIMTNHRLLPRIVRPTRIKNNSATLIDHIFTKNNNKTTISGILDTELAGNCGYTDHMPIFTILKSKIPRKDKSSKITVSYFTTEGHRARREGLLNESWDDVLSESDPNLIYDRIIHKYDSHYKKHLTTKQVNPRSSRVRLKPWMTDDILSDIRRRDRLARMKNRRNEY